MENIRCEVRNSELCVEKSKRAFLIYPADGLVPCALEETEDGVVFEFDTAGGSLCESVLKQAREEQYRFLINVAGLARLCKEYSFSLAPSNLLVDFNLKPQVLVRDICDTNVSFVEQYKALIGCVLQPKYKFEDYLQGGEGLYKKHKLLTAIHAMGTIEDIANRLWKEHKIHTRENQLTKRLVNKRSFLVSRIAIPVLGVLLVGALAFGGYALFFMLPQRSQVIEAMTAYVYGDSLAVQHSLENLSVEQMSFDVKYVLARSFVRTEAISEAQRENILMGLMQRTDEAIFDYWIALGRLEFDTAIDLAGRFNDDELMLFAYMKNEVYVQHDASLTGEERSQRLRELRGRINELNQAREEANARLNEAGEQ